MKNQRGLNNTVGICCVVIGLIVFFFSGKALYAGSVFIAAVLIVAGMFCIYISVAVKMVIDPINQTISFVKAFRKTPKVYFFDDFTGFQMLKVKRCGIFNINMLHMQFAEENGTMNTWTVRRYGASPLISWHHNF